MIEQGKGKLLKMYKFVKSTILESGLIKTHFWDCTWVIQIFKII